MRRRHWLAGALAAGVLVGVRAAGELGRVAAASDLQFALPEIAEAFHAQTPHRVQLNFGSSGNYARQILQGAPMDLFLSADVAYVHRLADAGLTRDRGTLYALGRIALIVPASSALPLDERLEGVRARAAGLSRFAIANPEHAPYGRAAREALERLGLWEMLRKRLVLGENVSQATQYVASGSAQAGITALSLASAGAVAAQTRHLRLPDTLHQPLQQAMVLLKHARPAAAAFRDFLTTPTAQRLLERHGFALPVPGR
jgi:molybdate transport system substrate-binding protein